MPPGNAQAARRQLRPSLIPNTLQVIAHPIHSPHLKILFNMRNTLISFTTLLLCLFGLNAANAQTAAQNKETTIKVLAAIDAGDLTSFSKYVSPAVKEHMPIPPDVPGNSDFEKVKNLIAGYHAAFPDSKTNVLNIVAEGDMVIVHSNWTGTNTGSFMGMPATNKPVSIEQVDIVRFDKAGKGVEHWAVLDQLTMLQQLGLIPADGK